MAATVLAAWLVGCGGSGGDGEPAGAVPATPPPGAATIGPEGGTVQGADGARVLVPAGAASAPTTVRIAKDATDMPALPAWLTAVGSVWQLTPHGSGFDTPVSVRLPVPARALADNEVLRVAKVSPGGQWELLTPEASDRDLTVNVRSFSYFVPVVEAYERTVRLPVLRLAITSLTCNGGPCDAIAPDTAEAVMELASNGGVVPQGCTNPKLVASVAGAGGWLAPQPSATALDPMERDFVVSQPSYRFRFQVRTPAATIAGTRMGVDGSINVALRCAGPPASDTGLLSAALSFPTKSGGVPEFRFGARLTDPTCNGGSCFEVSGTQYVQTTATVPAGAYVPPTCGSGTPALLFRRADGGILHTAPVRVQLGTTGLTTTGQTTSIAFSVAPPVGAGDYPVDMKLLCSGNLYAGGGTFILRFATPQAAVMPSFTTAPRSVAVRAAQTASFTVVAAGFPAPTLQWQSRADESSAWADLAGATSATHTTAATTLADNGRQFRVVATNSLGSVTSGVATLSVNSGEVGPVVLTQPANLGVVTGSDAAFAVHASGTGPLNYQWRFNGTPIVGANGTLLKLAAVGDAQAGRYSVEVSNAAGSVVSAEVVLAVSSVAVPVVAPSIGVQPLATTLQQDGQGLLAVIAAGTGPLSYQWAKADALAPAPRTYTPIAGANTPTLQFGAATAADAAWYRVTVTNAAGSLTSTEALVQVAANPLREPVAITVQPSPQVQMPGGSAMFAVGATGGGRLAFQWLKNGNPIAGATAAVLTLPGLGAADAALYSVRVSNATSSVTSDSVLLTVVGAPTIITQPMAVQVTEGDRATFSVAATGAGLRYQWLRDHEPIVGADQASYSPPAAALADDGAVFRVVVYNGAGALFSERALLTVQPKLVDPPETKIAAGLNHTCAVHGSGALYCWGNGGNGELGYGTAEYRAVPTRVTGLLGVKAVAAGGLTSCAIDGSDTLWCWGGLVDALSPVRISAVGEAVRAVAVGMNHACYVDGGGAVRCWGGNDMGQLGDGSTDAQPNPVPVLRGNGSAFTGAVALAAGNRYSCAQLGDGSVWCWGMDIDSNARTAPGRVVRRLPGGQTMDFTAYGRIVGGLNHACAIESGAGQPLCWGFNPEGQLGDGTTVARNEAMPAGLFGAERLMAGVAHTCAIRNLDVHCWGTAFMGNGGARQTLLSVEAAGRVSAFTGADPVRAGAAGERHTCVLQASGTVQCWGWNHAGQIGNDAVTIDALVPVSTTLGAEFWGP